MEGEQRSSEKDDGHEIVYKTKVVQFLGRSTPIILQNDNGPCPLLAICNVLLLRDSLNLGADAPEVSLQKLLSLVAEKLIDSISNSQDKDDGYLMNQQQNIADAIDLLPRLATGIDVNVQFRMINDFEFTRECAIFDLLDIGLYHGWLVDPQDTETAAAIGSKSYNTLVAELVAFETSMSTPENKNVLEEDSVDFVAATTATLGVPSPCLSRGRSFDDGPDTVSLEESRKGDIEEAEELRRALDLSKTQLSISVNAYPTPEANSSNILEEGFESEVHHNLLATKTEVQPAKSELSDLFTLESCNLSVDSKDDALNANINFTEDGVLLSNCNVSNPVSEDPNSDVAISGDSVENLRTDMSMPSICPSQSIDVLTVGSRRDQSVSHIYVDDLFKSQLPNSPLNNLDNCDPAVLSATAATCADVHLASGTKEIPDASEVGSSSLDDNEPIYEGEECILDPELPKYEEKEPVYGGEVFLARRADKEEDPCTDSKEKAAVKQCYLIKNFLESTASQLTIFGLFCLQEGLKERELCVFFRNNHFNTMFKFNGELYLLATDQGYINQPDLVWEKLIEVNGDTVFMTGNFTQFKIENDCVDSWNEQNAMTNTADYLATLDASHPESSFNSDLQLAIALQQQEFGQQSQQQPERPKQPSSQEKAASGRSSLVTGPQVSRRSHISPKAESKKGKCTMM